MKVSLTRRSQVACVILAAVAAAIALTAFLRHRTRMRGIEVFATRPLVRTADHEALVVPGLIQYPVGIAHWQGDVYLVCNYASLQEINVRTGAVRLLEPPAGLSVWNPTGVWVDAASGLVIVANYTGHDVLEMRRLPEGLVLLRRYIHPDMRSPENVDRSADGNLLGAADYDGNRLWVFRRDGSLAWSRPAPLAHGVAFGPDFVAVSSLGDRSVVRYDLDGRLLNRTGTAGWGSGKYLWPTCLHRHGDHLLVSDAHNGKITVLDQSLREVRWVGGNGPGPAVFNMPYAIGGRSGEVLVCDTFKSRILVLDEDFNCRCVLAREASALPWDTSTRPARTWRGYTDLSAPCSVNLPGLPSGTWNPSYSAYAVSGSWKTTTARYPLSGSLLNPGSFAYFCWSVAVSHGGQEFLLLGHSQGKRLLVVDAQGRCHLVDAGQHLWEEAGSLRTDDGAAFDPHPHIETALRALAEHDRLRAAEASPEEALRRACWPDLAPAAFAERLQQSFVTPAGKTFCAAWQQANTLEQRREAAQAFDLAVREMTDTIFLQELFLRNMLVPRRL
jgi:hypothetical protein